MPELPEAETIVRGLRATVLWRTIRSTRVIRPDILRQSKRLFANTVRGRTIERIARRGKNVIIGLDGDRVIAVNLGMTGRLLPFDSSPRGDRRPGHPAVRFRFEGGGLLIFDDTRRFGTVEALDGDAWRERSARMGPEPLDEAYRPEQLVAGLRTSRAPARSWLLDQRRIAGVGNIYANEALYLAGVRPDTPARDITDAQGVALHGTIRAVLQAAVDAGGTTIRDYRNTDGGRGEYVSQLYVYGREGRPCRRCGATVEKLVFANRSAFLCPVCQPGSA